MALAIIWLGSIITSVILAIKKRRSLFFWPFITIFTGPIGVLLLLCMKKRPKPRALIVPTPSDVASIRLKVGDTVDGLRAHIDIQETSIRIRRDDEGRNTLIHGMKGDKSISYRSISAIQLRMPTAITSGYIQFSIVGGREGTRGIFEAAGDENSILFVDTQSARMMALRDFLERRVEGAHEMRATTAPIANVADELIKLADLKDRGAITNEEFETRKSMLLR